MLQFSVDGWSVPTGVARDEGRAGGKASKAGGSKEPSGADGRGAAPASRQKRDRSAASHGERPRGERDEKRPKHGAAGADRRVRDTEGRHGGDAHGATQSRAERRQGETRRTPPASARGEAQTAGETRRDKQHKQHAPLGDEGKAVFAEPAAAGPGKARLTALQTKMQQKLSGGRFRWLNERLYTTASAEAKRTFTVQMLREYHDGFRQQVQGWPENPVDKFIARLRDTLKGKRKHRLTVADLGCGDAKIARTMQLQDPKQERVRVRSFDLEQIDELVEPCDIANLPLSAASVDIAIFCLSLMGTNYVDFLREANRVMKQGGQLWVAEIKSRFGAGQAAAFRDGLESLGFKVDTVDDSNRMFTTFYAVKVAEAEQGHAAPALETLLKPCIYKRR